MLNVIILIIGKIIENMDAILLIMSVLCIITGIMNIIESRDDLLSKDVFQAIGMIVLAILIIRAWLN